MALFFAAMLPLAVRLADEFVEILVGLGPTRVVVVDPVTHSRNDLGPDLEAEETIVRTAMTFGASMGIFGSMALCTMLHLLGMILVDADGRTLIKFLKASGGDELPRSSA